MAAPKRNSQFVYILVPEVGVVERTIWQASAAACRVALGLELTPICPPLQYSPFLTPEERSTRLPKICWEWLRRVSKIWLQFPSIGCDDLDAFSYRLLAANERWPTRRPVYQLERYEDSFVPVAMPREQIRDLLSCNLSVGLARRCI